MRYICLLLAFLMLLCGCSPEAAVPTVPETDPTAAPTAAATEPPVTTPADPLEVLLGEMTT